MMDAIAIGVTVGIAAGYFMAGVLSATIWLARRIVDWRLDRLVRQDRAHALAHPERNDLSAIIYRGQERFRSPHL